MAADFKTDHIFIVLYFNCVREVSHLNICSKCRVNRHVCSGVMSEAQEVAEINYEEQYRILSEENKKLSIDIASLQLSNRSLVNQNRDEKKKVMDCRLQISDLEKTQLQAERLRQTLDANENKLHITERRATEAEGLVKN
nr:hypothetical transcript [Hymenolepis microstoma]